MIGISVLYLDVVKAFTVIGNISGVFEIPDSSSNIQRDTRTATDLGWRHGTELRLEML